MFVIWGYGSWKYYQNLRIHVYEAFLFVSQYKYLEKLINEILYELLNS